MTKPKHKPKARHKRARKVVPKVTSGLLKRHKACGGDLETFAKEWPRGAKVTMANIARARELGLDVGWLWNLLSPAQRKRYSAVTNAADLQYKEAYDECRFTYNNETGPANRAYQEACKKADEVCRRAKDEAYRVMQVEAAESQETFNRRTQALRELRYRRLDTALLDALLKSL